MTRTRNGERGMRQAPVLVLMLALVSPALARDPSWEVERSRHFLIHYIRGEKFVEQVRYRAEEYYRTITEDLGFSKINNVWLWDRRTKIYIYPSRMAYVRGTGSPAWTAGRAAWDLRSIYTYAGSAEFLESVLPHELTHLIFIEFMGSQEKVPLWLHEGVAQWQDRDARRVALPMARELAKRGRLTPLATLMEVDVRGERNVGKVLAFYAQAVSLVAYLVEEQGAVRFREFCGHVRDDKTIADALRFTYPRSVRSIEVLEAKWRAWLLEGVL